MCCYVELLYAEKDGGAGSGGCFSARTISGVEMSNALLQEVLLHFLVVFLVAENDRSRHRNVTMSSNRP
jgi:hypothetical protein